jgi:DNA-binding transcriptional ArsR family regulator
MKQKRIKQVDSRTGEEVDGFLVCIPKKRFNGFTEGWLAVAQLGLDTIAERRKELGEEGLAVFMAILARVDFGNDFLLNQSKLGRKLGMHRQSVQKAIKRLIVMGILLEGEKEGQSRIYQLNPNIGWKGSAKNHHKALADQRKARMKAAKITGVVKTPPSETNPEK